jgi:hypothetical protein
MKFIYFILFLFLISCNSVKIKEMEMDSTQDLTGKIQQINISTIHYPISIKDTITREEKSVIFFDSKNKITRQIDFYPKFKDETSFVYKNKQLVSTISKIGNQTTIIEYKYDKNKNVIEYKQLVNDTLIILKTSTYDKRNNLTEETRSFPNYMKNNSFEKFETDYKNRTVKIQSFDENRKMKNHYLKTYFNKKGYVIKTEFIYPNSNKDYSTYSIIEYDRFGNLMSRKNLDKERKVKESIDYKNTYDENGNIIIREKYLTEKLIEKTTFQIIYQ